MCFGGYSSLRFQAGCVEGRQRQNETKLKDDQAAAGKFESFTASSTSISLASKRFRSKDITQNAIQRSKQRRIRLGDRPRRLRLHAPQPARCVHWRWLLGADHGLQTQARTAIGLRRFHHLREES